LIRQTGRGLALAGQMQGIHERGGVKPAPTIA
jgi:hypothetical protein